MSDFVHCPECDSDIEGAGWEMHLGSHGWIRVGWPTADRIVHLERELVVAKGDATDMTRCREELLGVVRKTERQLAEARVLLQYAADLLDGFERIESWLAANPEVPE